MDRTIIGLETMSDVSGRYAYVEWSDGSVDRWFKAHYDSEWWKEGLVPSVGW